MQVKVLHGTGTQRIKENKNVDRPAIETMDMILK